MNTYSLFTRTLCGLAMVAMVVVAGVLTVATAGVGIV